MTKDGFVKLAAGILTIAIATAGQALPQQATSTDADYIAKAMTAAPEAISKNATIVAMDKSGTLRTVQKGTNQFTCMLMGGSTPMCADQNGMEWVHALMTHSAPPDKVGFMYMLGGDDGASNTDPYATGPTSDNHWVKTGPHVMVLGPATKAMAGYPRTANPDPTKPYVMWAGTPYEHLMIPVK
ncbi:MAG: hypothetical protein ACXWNK_16350 [Vulcanimicrobiaceae bacterium]